MDGLADLKRLTESVNEHWDTRMPLMAAEECGEFVQALSKMQRWFYTNPNGVWESVEKKSFQDLKAHLVEEMGDVFIVIGALMNRYDISPDDIRNAVKGKLSEERTV